MSLRPAAAVLGFAAAWLLWPQSASADNCGSLSDCFNTLRAALAAAVGVGAFAALASFGLDLLPGIGTAKGVIEAFTGRDLVTGAELAWWERALGVVPLIGGIAAAGSLARAADRLGDAADAGADLVRARAKVFGSSLPSGVERPFAGGLEAAQGQFDDVLSNLFRQSKTGDFQGIWLNRSKATQFDDLDLAVYFQREKHVTGRVVGEEVQHAIDFTMGATKRQVIEQAARRGVPESEVVEWWHRRVFTRLLQNADANRHGLGAVTPYADDIYRAYQSVGGKLPLDDLLTRTFEGLY